MKTLKFFLVFLFIFNLLFISTVFCHAVIGIDFGTEFLKIGLVKSGSPIDIVMNEQSQRKTSTLVGFKKSQEINEETEKDFGLIFDRTFGDSAISLITRIPEQVIRRVNVLLGEKHELSSSHLSRLIDDLRLPTTMFAKNKSRNGTIDFVLRDSVTKKSLLSGSKSEDIAYNFTMEEIYAMILRYIVALSEKQAGEPVSGAVISIPPFYTIQQRQSILDAAKIAKLNVLGLQQSTTSLALQYGFSKYRLLLSKARGDEPSIKEHNVLFFDFGSDSLVTSVATFQPPKQTSMDELGHIKIRAVNWENNFGGTDLDKRLADLIISKFISEKAPQAFPDVPNKVIRSELMSDQGLIRRIYGAAKKVKETLSANKDAHSTIEEFFRGKDFTFTVSRKDFNEQILGEEYIRRCVTVANNAVRDSGLSWDNIHSLEVFGGATRVPHLKKELKEQLLGQNSKELGHSLNSDEAIALGAAYYAATLSPLFVSRKFEIVDIYPQEIDFSIENLPNTAQTAKEIEERDKKIMLFKKKEHIGTKKIMNMPIPNQVEGSSNNEINLRLHYVQKQESYPENGAFSIFNFKQSHINQGLADSLENAIKLSKKANETIKSTEPEKKKIRLAFRLNNDGLINLEKATVFFQLDVEVPVVKKVPSSNNSTNSTKTEETITEIEKITRSYEKEIPFVVKPTALLPLSTKEITESIKRLDSLDKFDAMKTDLSAKRNQFESMLYSYRGTFIDNFGNEENEFKNFYDEKVKQTMETELENLENWLESAENSRKKHGINGLSKMLDEKTKSIKLIVDPIYKRKQEFEAAEAAKALAAKLAKEKAEKEAKALKEKLEKEAKEKAEKEAKALKEKLEIELKAKLEQEEQAKKNAIQQEQQKPTEDSPKTTSNQKKKDEL